MRPGRPPRRADGPTTLTVRLSAADKNLLIDQADAFGMSITEYIITLIHRDAAITEDTIAS